MKKMLLLAVVLLLLFGAGTASGEEEGSDTIFFGAYEQDNDFENGQEPIEWIKLKTDGDHIYLLSRYILDCKPYNEKQEGTSWQKCSLRSWLNHDFFQEAFTVEEKACIDAVMNYNSLSAQNPDWITNDGTIYDTYDKVFLLSYIEAMDLFSDAEARKTKGTEYARAKGAKFLGVTSVGLENADWWLRTAGKNAKEAGYVGVIHDIHTKDVKEKIGVRPVIALNLETWKSMTLRYETSKAAMQLESEGKYAEAIEQYEMLGDYNNSAARITECRYQMAEMAYDTGDYDRAMLLFEKVGQYKNSMERMKSCFDKANIRVWYFSDKKPVDAGVDTGYSKMGKIEEKDPHYGWKLGQFFISGYTEDKTDRDGQIVFIRTVGDTPTLWFDLQQDIDALNGNEKLVIGEDTNGYDQYFETAKTNFGRGTLIVRHTDTQNREGEVNIYTDYLLAKGTVGANTKIELNEEGKYEIALDYEIQDNELTHIISKYHNYRIAFEFWIRNGNNMVFLLDTDSNTELQNGAVTTSGFQIDWAGSKELEVKVRYSVLQQGTECVTEDVRFERPTKDKDTFGDAGIYTITINDSVTKKIIVNPNQNDLLERYAENGFSTEGLK